MSNKGSMLLAAAMLGLSMAPQGGPEVRARSKVKNNPPRKHKHRGTGGQGGAPKSRKR